MKKNRILLYITEISILIGFGIYQIFYIKDLNLECDSFSEFLIQYLGLRSAYKYVNFSLVIWQMSPVIIYIIFHGTLFYSEWDINNIYIIIRYKRRSQLFLKSMVNMLISAVGMSFLFFMFLIMLYNSFGYSAVYTINILFNLTILYFSYSLIFSLISLKIGSAYGLFVSLLIFVIETVFSVFSVYHKNVVSLIFRIVFAQANFFNLIISGKCSCIYFFIPILRLILLFLTGKLITKNMDIGIKDNESE